VIDAAPEDWVARWFEYHRLACGTREQRKALEVGQPIAAQAAYDWVQDRMIDGGLEAVDAIAELAQAASNEHEQSLVGIGPVEELIYGHGDVAVPLLLDRARQLPALAEALSWVSLASESVSNESLAKLAAYRRPHN
jgi:hypothetical protein